MANSVFSIPFNELQKWSVGEPIRAEKLNQSVGLLNRLARGVDGARQLSPVVAGAGSASAQFRYKSMAADHIVCRTWDGETEGDEDVLVAKPYLLRRTPFDGKSRGEISYVYGTDIERTATNAQELTENQVIIPSFQVDDTIYATLGIDGGTGVVDSDDEAIERLDDNRDARAWMKKHA